MAERLGVAMEYSSRFDEQQFAVNGTNLFSRVAKLAGKPLVLFLHGHTQASEMWAPLANQLDQDGYAVAAVDLPGLGRSSAAEGRYDKKSNAVDLKALVSALGHDDTPVYVIGHDLGAFAAYAYAAQFARGGDKLVLMDATVPGIGIWSELLSQPRTWHFGFYGTHAEALVQGRERIYLDRHWDEFAANPAAMTPAMRERYTSYHSQPGGMRSAFSHFRAFERDAADNVAFAKSKLAIPVLGLGGEHSLGSLLPEHLQMIAETSTARTIPNAGHWLIEENLDDVTNAIRQFLRN